MHQIDSLSLLLTLAIALLVGSCEPSEVTNSAAMEPRPASSSAAPEACQQVEHQLGTTEICGQPQRIVVLSPHLLEQVLALGAQPAGFGDYIAFHSGDYDNPTQQIPYLGDRITTQPINVGLAYQPSIEAILRVQPDLILSPDYNAGQYEALSQIAPTLILDVSSGQTNLATIGQALHRTASAEALLAAMSDQIATARTRFAPVVKQYPTVLLLSSEDAQSFALVSHANSFCGSLIQDLGFQLIYPEEFDAATLRTPAPVSLDALPGLNAADSIILFGFSWDTAGLDDMTTFKTHQLDRLKQTWDRNAIAQSLNASQAGRVYFIPAYLCLGLPGPIGTELYLDELEKQLLADQ
jgi:iron complex transport system substrate-binding protein